MSVNYKGNLHFYLSNCQPYVNYMLELQKVSHLTPKLLKFINILLIIGSNH